MTAEQRKYSLQEMVIVFIRLFRFGWTVIQIEDTMNWEHRKRGSVSEQSKVLGTWAETLDIMACATLIRRKIFLYSKSTCKWLKFEQLFLQDIYNKVPMASSVARKKCMCPVTLTYNDFNPLSNHFNLLIPTGPCCECPEPENNFENTTIHLDTDGLSHGHMPKDSDTLSKDCMSENNRHTKNSKPTIKSRKKRQTGRNKTNESKELLDGNKQ